jgi:glycosyltransferase involved in cell wall biosynthesis
LIISIVLPVYNAEKYLDDCLASICEQTYNENNYELIAINDGSTDNCLDILEKYKKVIKNMTIISRENKGLIYTLNEAIRISRGNFICRMDADDIMTKDRLEVQYEFLVSNNEYVACGASYEHIGDLEKKVIAPEFNNVDVSLAYMIFENSFAHPTMMIRKFIFNEFTYSEENDACEDFVLWRDILLGGYKITNIKKILLKYRTHNAQISISKSKLQNKNVAKESMKILNHFGIKSSEGCILNLQRPVYAKNKYDENTDKLFEELIAIKQINKNIFYKHLSLYCFYSNKKLSLYKGYFKFRNVYYYLLYLPLVFIDKSIIKNLIQGKK